MAMSRWQFVCKNEKCEHKDHGFVFLCPWPLGEIDAVINSRKVLRDSTLKEQLENLKLSGRKYACIQYPDPDNIPVIGYRINLWCDQCANLSEFDMLISDEDKEKMVQENLCANDEKIVENTIANSNIPKECPVCKETFMTYKDIWRKVYLTCPSCKTKSIPIPNVWFANEKPIR